MTLFENNMDIGLLDLYGAPAEIDLSGLTPEHVHTVASWKSEQFGGMIIEFTLKGSMMNDFKIDVDVIGRGGTGKYLKPSAVRFESNGIIKLECDAWFHGPNANNGYAGVWRFNTEITNLIIPEWMKRKARMLQRRNVKSYEGEEDAGHI